MKVVDIHSHLFSRAYFDALAVLAPGLDEPDAKLEALVDRTGIELPPADIRTHVERWIAELDRHGVDHLVTFASLTEEIPTVTRAVEIAGGRISACALVNPKTPGAAEDVWSLIRDNGYRGVLLFPAMHHYRLSGEDAAHVFHVLDDRRALAFVHCGMLTVKLRDLLGLPRENDLSFANPIDLVPAADAAPRARFVIPHFGAGFFRETLMAGAQCENVYVDTSSSHSWLRTQSGRPTLRDAFEQTLDVFGPDRILFGTDSSVFPAGWRHERLEEQRAVLAELGLDDEDAGKILGGNAARLLSEVATD